MSDKNTVGSQVTSEKSLFSKFESVIQEVIQNPVQDDAEMRKMFTLVVCNQDCSQRENNACPAINAVYNADKDCSTKVTPEMLSRKELAKLLKYYAYPKKFFLQILYEKYDRDMLTIFLLVVYLSTRRYLRPKETLSDSSSPPKVA